MRELRSDVRVLAFGPDSIDGGAVPDADVTGNTRNPNPFAASLEKPRFRGNMLFADSPADGTALLALVRPGPPLPVASLTLLL